MYCAHKKRVRAFLWETDLLSDPAEQVWEGSRHQAVRSTGSSKFLFYNSHFLRVTVLRPTGVAILSAPLLSVCKLFSYVNSYVYTHFAPCRKDLYQAVGQGRIWLHVPIASSEVWHGHQPTRTNNWHRKKNPAVFLPGLNVRILLRGLI